MICAIPNTVEGVKKDSRILLETSPTEVNPCIYIKYLGVHIHKVSWMMTCRACSLQLAVCRAILMSNNQINRPGHFSQIASGSQIGSQIVSGQ